MGMRSDVGFCVAPGIEVPKFEDIEPDWEFDKIIRDKRGTFYYVEDIKWNDWLDGTPKTVSAFLATLSPDDYQLVIMNEGNAEVTGERWDNEFELGYRCEITFDGVCQ